MSAEELLCCDVCFVAFSVGISERRPVIACANGHSFCTGCLAHLRNAGHRCPKCRSNLLPHNILNRDLLNIIEERNGNSEDDEQSNRGEGAAAPRFVTLTMGERTAAVEDISSTLNYDHIGNDESTIEEMDNSLELRIEMVEVIKRDYLINTAVAAAMLAVPRHHFVNMPSPQTSPRGRSTTNSGKVAWIYQNHKVMPATSSTLEAPSRTIGRMLSLADVRPGSNVLFLNGKGGYTEMLLAKLAGPLGTVMTICKDQAVIDVSRQRCHQAMNMEWIRLDRASDMFDQDALRALLSTDRTFDVVIFNTLAPSPLRHGWWRLLRTGGRLLVGVRLRERDDKARYEVWIKDKPPTGRQRIRITDHVINVFHWNK